MGRVKDYLLGGGEHLEVGMRVRVVDGLPSNWGAGPGCHPWHRPRDGAGGVVLRRVCPLLRTTAATSTYEAGVGRQRTNQGGNMGADFLMASFRWPGAATPCTPR